MQPRWLPALRAALGVAVVLGALVALVATRPGPVGLVVVAAWSAYGVFLVWASRHEHSGTRLQDDAIVLTEGRRVRRLTRADILDVRPDAPGEQAWRVQALLADGSLVTLLGVPPSELERLRRWHTGV